MYLSGTDLLTSAVLASTRPPTEMERLKGDLPTEEQFNSMEVPNTTGSGWDGVNEATGSSEDGEKHAGNQNLTTITPHGRSHGSHVRYIQDTMTKGIFRVAKFL